MTEANEVWLPVSALDGNVEVSSAGRVRRVARALIYNDGRRGMLPAGILKGGVTKAGYLVVSYGPKKFLAHRLIAETFLDAPSELLAYQTVNHKNGDKLDNRPENLEWASYQANNSHARDTGLNRQHGERCTATKYGEQLIAAMRRVHEKYSPTIPDLAQLFGISERHVADVIAGKSRVREM